jgi:hypothetical protein
MEEEYMGELGEVVFHVMMTMMRVGTRWRMAAGVFAFWR